MNGSGRLGETSRRVRSWQRLEFTIEIRNGWAKIGFFFHPQLANFFMRYGLPEKERVEMEILHEFGHVQVFPFVLMYYIPFYFSGISGIWKIRVSDCDSGNAPLLGSSC